MRQHPMETLARDLREALDSGAFTHRGQVTLNDGMLVNPERMARIILVDFERMTQDKYGQWLAEDQERALYDDLLRLLHLARETVRA